MFKKILIISPHFPPINAPDHQRVRMMLPYLKELGWDVHVLAVKSEYVSGGVKDPILTESLPSECRITYTKAVSTKLTRLFGMGTLGWRSLPYIAQEGDRLLKEEKYDLIFFSTTQFPVMILGSRWLKKFGVPYIIDLQDPWVSTYQHKAKPPGGRLKYGIAQFFAKIFEPTVMKHAVHIITVSPQYPQMLLNRYPSLDQKKFSVIPFGAPEKDFELLSNCNVQQDIFDPKDGKQHWVYIGRGGEDMAFSLRTLFLAIKIKREENPEAWKSIQLYFVGTSYAPEGKAQKTIEPIAREMGVEDLVKEHTTRIPYFNSLKLLVDSSCIMIIGSDDPSYTASKIYPYILAQKPILGIFHEQSSAVEILNKSIAAQVITFNALSKDQEIVERTKIRVETIFSLPKEQKEQINWSYFKKYTASEMTAQICNIFDKEVTSLN